MTGTVNPALPLNFCREIYGPGKLSCLLYLPNIIFLTSIQPTLSISTSQPQVDTPPTAPVTAGPSPPQRGGAGGTTPSTTRSRTWTTRPSSSLSRSGRGSTPRTVAVMNTTAVTAVSSRNIRRSSKNNTRVVNRVLSQGFTLWM